VEEQFALEMRLEGLGLLRVEEHEPQQLVVMHERHGERTAVALRHHVPAVARRVLLQLCRKVGEQSRHALHGQLLQRPHIAQAVLVVLQRDAVDGAVDERGEQIVGWLIQRHGDALHRGRHLPHLLMDRPNLVAQQAAIHLLHRCSSRARAHCRAVFARREWSLVSSLTT
jgi:hypothetical protein